MSNFLRPQNLLGKRLGIGIFGPSLCGKSNVAKWLIEIYWTHFRIRSVVCDPNPMQKWPACALVFRDPSKFWAYIWKVRGCAIFVDEAGGSVARDNSITGAFTRGRQQDHVLHVMGHRMTNLLPEQRDQLATLFLFTQSPSAAKIWAEEWADLRLLESTSLPQYEFLWCEKYGDKATRRHSIRHATFPEFK